MLLLSLQDKRSQAGFARGAWSKILGTDLGVCLSL